jgi:hypothetical protein
MIVIGGLALAISPFLTWVNAVLLGGLNLFDALQITGRPEFIAWIGMSMGGAAALIALASPYQRVVRYASICAGLVSGIGSFWVLNTITSDVRVMDGLAQLSYGPWVAILGCCSILAGGLLSVRSRPRDAPEE